MVALRLPPANVLESLRDVSGGTRDTARMAWVPPVPPQKSNVDAALGVSLSRPFAVEARLQVQQSVTEAARSLALFAID